MSTSPLGGIPTRLPSPPPVFAEGRSLSEGQVHPISVDDSADILSSAGLKQDVLQLSRQEESDGTKLPDAPSSLGKSPGSTRASSEPSPDKKTTPRKKTTTPRYVPSGPPVGILVEDEDLQRKTQRALLEGSLRVPFDTAANFDEAQQKLSTYPYKILVTDHNLSADKKGTASRTAYDKKRAELFPDGLDDKYAEGSVLLRLARLLPPQLRPKATLLVSSPVGVTVEELTSYASAEGAHFHTKPMVREHLISLFKPFLTKKPSGDPLPDERKDGPSGSSASSAGVRAETTTTGTPKPDETKAKTDLPDIEEEGAVKEGTVKDDLALAPDLAKAMSLGESGKEKSGTGNVSRSSGEDASPSDTKPKQLAAV